MSLKEGGQARMEKYMGQGEIEADPALSYQSDLSANRMSELTPFSSCRTIVSSLIKLSHLHSVPIDCVSRRDRPFTFCCLMFHSYRGLQHSFEAMAADLFELMLPPSGSRRSTGA
jgi:hypothetical protein